MQAARAAQVCACGRPASHPGLCKARVAQRRQAGAQALQQGAKDPSWPMPRPSTTCTRLHPVRVGLDPAPAGRPHGRGPHRGPPRDDRGGERKWRRSRYDRAEGDHSAGRPRSRLSTSRPRGGPAREAPIFASKLRQTIAQKLPPSAKVEHLRGLLQNAGVKGDEIKWSGLTDFAHQRHSADTVSRDEALAHLDAAPPEAPRDNARGEGHQVRAVHAAHVSVPEGRRTARRRATASCSSTTSTRRSRQHRAAESGAGGVQQEEPGRAPTPRDPRKAFTTEYKRVIDKLQAQEFERIPQESPEREQRLLHLDDAAWRHMDTDAPLDHGGRGPEGSPRVRRSGRGRSCRTRSRPSRRRRRRAGPSRRRAEARPQALGHAAREASKPRGPAPAHARYPALRRHAANILSHTRFAPRDLAHPDGTIGNKVSHIEEIQSDWHQAGRTRATARRRSRNCRRQGHEVRHSKELGSAWVRTPGGANMIAQRDARGGRAAGARSVQRGAGGPEPERAARCALQEDVARTRLPPDAPPRRRAGPRGRDVDHGPAAGRSVRPLEADRPPPLQPDDGRPPRLEEGQRTAAPAGGDAARVR